MVHSLWVEDKVILSIFDWDYSMPNKTNGNSYFHAIALFF